MIIQKLNGVIDMEDDEDIFALIAESAYYEDKWLEEKEKKENDKNR